jgi:PHD/YefM family antitoxin component YafN of YafNO toxin-antitoxin module
VRNDLEETMPSSTKLPDVIPMSDLEHGAAVVFQRLRQSGSPTIITQEGRAAAVLIDIEAFRRGESERDILALLARGEREIAEDVGYDLDEVLAEADQLLARHDS